MVVAFYKSNEMSPNLGGVSRINCSLYDALSQRGNKCFFISSTYNADIVSYGEQLYLPNTEEECCEGNRLWLTNLINELNINVIINNNFTAKSIIFLDEARLGTRCKVITWVHNNIVEYGSLLGFRKEKQLKDNHLGLIYHILTSKPIIKTFRFFSKIKHAPTAKLIYQRSDCVITVCDGNIGEFLYLLGHADNENKVLSIPNFVPAIDNEASYSDKEHSVVWCGAVDYSLKKTNWMLQIWKMVEKKHSDWTLTIMGDGKQLNSIKEYAKQLGLERVVFTGRVNPNPFYQKASILCSTSISESFGLTLVEGMQRRVVPIAFASSPAIRDVVGYNGVLVSPFNKKKFAKELSELMDNDKKRYILAEKGRIASVQYDENQIVKVWQILLQDFGTL